MSRLPPIRPAMPPIGVAAAASAAPNTTAMAAAITKSFQTNNEPIRRVRMIGIVFSNPGSTFAKSEIIPQIPDWHVRSGKSIDLYFAGYSRIRPLESKSEFGVQEVPIPGTNSNWFYSPEHFDKFRREIQAKAAWSWSGARDLLLANARFDVDRVIAVPDFTSTMTCQLNAMKKDEAIESVEKFVESIFKFAESDATYVADPTSAFSDAQGFKIARSAAKRWIISLLPTKLGATYRKAEHFVVRNLALS